MKEKIRRYLRHPDRLNLSVFLFTVIAYFLSNKLSGPKQSFMFLMVLFMVSGGIFFAFILSRCVITIFLSNIALLLFVSRKFNIWILLFVLAAFFLNSLAVLFYLEKEKYIRIVYSVNFLNSVDFSSFLKIFIFSNIIPFFVASIALIQKGRTYHLFFLILAYALIANFYFWHNLVESRSV